MKKIITLILVSACTLCINASDKANRFAIKSGYVKYELTGNTTGTETLYWDDYGEKTRTEIQSKTVTKMLGFTNEDKAQSINIIIKDKFWDADLIKKNGYTGKIPYYHEIKQNVENMSEEEQKQLEEDVMASLGGKKEGTETFLGYKCDVITIMGTKSLFYKGIILKSEINMMGTRNKKIAVEFKPNTKVNAKLFKPYDGVQYTDVSKQQQNLMGGMFNMNNADNSDNDQNTGLFGMLGSAVAAENTNENIDDEKLEPIKYPFNDFKTGIAKAKIPDNYKPMGIMNIDNESYLATYMSGMNMMMISAVSDSETNQSDHELQNLQKFKHNGRQYTYGEILKENQEDEDGSMIMVEYPKKKMNIIILTLQNKMTKNELIKVAESLNFK